MNVTMAPVRCTLMANPDVVSIVQQHNRQQTATSVFRVNELEPGIAIEKLLMHKQHRGAHSSLQRGRS